MYYWVINPVKSNIEKLSVNGFTVFNREHVVSGNTALGAEGKTFFDIWHRKVSLYDHSLWVFVDECFETQDEAKLFSKTLCVITEAVYGLKISGSVADTPTKTVAQNSNRKI